MTTRRQSSFRNKPWIARPIQLKICQEKNLFENAYILNLYKNSIFTKIVNPYPLHCNGTISNVVEKSNASPSYWNVDFIHLLRLSLAEGHRTSASLVPKPAPSTRMGLACTTPVPLHYHAVADIPSTSQPGENHETVSLFYRLPYIYFLIQLRTEHYLFLRSLRMFDSVFHSWILGVCCAVALQVCAEEVNPLTWGLNWALEEGVWRGR